MDFLRPAPGTKSFDYRGNTLGAYEEVARQFGLTVTFDQDIASKSIRFRLADADFFTAAYVLGQQTNTFIRALAEKMFFVTNDTPEKRRQYEPRLTLTVPLDAAGTPERMNEIRQVMRDIAGITNLQLDTRTRQLTLTGSPAAVTLARELVAELGQAPSEVMLEVNLFEIDRASARRLGIRPPSEARMFTLTPEQIREAQSSSEGLLRVLTEVFGSTGSTTLTSQQALGQLGTGSINPASLIPPLIAFGGGRSIFLATLPGASADFAESFSLLRRARRVLLRSEDGQQATFFVGDRFPISLGVLTPSTTAPIVIGNVRVDDYTAGDEPRAVATGDFDGASGLDFVVANAGENTLSLFLNTGSEGRFAAATTLTVDDGPRAVLARDLNGDSFVDLAVAHVRANTISVLLGAGDGTFTQSASFATSLEPVALVSGEFTGGGGVDLIVANQGSDSVTLFPGNGDGTFGAGTEITVGVAPRAVIVADWNGDSFSDLAVANSGSNTVSILLGDGAGNFTPAPDLATADTPSAFATGDFNLDGSTDLVVTNEDSNSISVFLGLGGGTFGARTDVPVGANPSSILAADFTGDGRLDLVIANSGVSVITVLAGLATGDFAAGADVPLNAAPFALASGDFDADGRLDVVAANPEADSATVIINGATTTDTGTSIATAAQAYPAALYEDIGIKVRATPRLHPTPKSPCKCRLRCAISPLPRSTAFPSSPTAPSSKPCACAMARPLFSPALSPPIPPPALPAGLGLAPCPLPASPPVHAAANNATPNCSSRLHRIACASPRANPAAFTPAPPPTPPRPRHPRSRSLAV
jgi:hypothetical protein